MKLSADMIAGPVGVGPDHFNKQATKVGISGERKGKSHARFYTESEAAKVYPRKARLIHRVFSSVAAAGVSSGHSPDRGSQPDSGATPPSTLSPTGAAADSFLTLPDWKSKRALARAEILAAQRSNGLGDEEFKDQYDAGRVLVTDETRGFYPKVSLKQLSHWSKRASGGTAALGPRWGNRLGTGLIDSTPHFQQTILAMITKWPTTLRSPHVYQALKAKFPGGEIPSVSAIRTWLAAWKEENPSLYNALRNPDRWKGTDRIKIADASAHVTRLNEEWQIDGTPGDVELIDGRYHVLQIIDVFSGRKLFYVAPSESADAAITLLCRAMIEWRAVPEVLRGDGGAGFVSNRALRFLADLRIQYIKAPAFTPEAKGQVESGFNTISHDLFPLLPGHIGSSVAQRQELRGQTSFASRFGARAAKVVEIKLTRIQFQEKIDTWAKHIDGERKRPNREGKSSNQIAAEYPGETRIVDEKQLALIAGDALVRHVGRDGVKIEGEYFLPTIETLAGYVAHMRQEALAYPDPKGDPGRFLLFVEKPSGREFVAVVENRKRLGMDRSNLAILARQAQNRFIREGRASLRRIKNRIRPETIIDAILDQAVSNAPSREPQSQEVPHHTPALNAAAVALNVHSTGKWPASNITQILPQESVEQETESDRKYREYCALKAKPLHTTLEKQRISVAESSEWFKARQQLGLLAS